MDFKTLPYVLIADDQEEIRESLARVLGEFFNVIVVKDGKLAIEYILSGGPHSLGLVITDFSMPEADGLEVARALRTCGDRIPIIVITGTPELSGTPLATLLALPNTQCLQKPFTMAQLWSVIRPLFPGMALPPPNRQ